ncbi:outer membrane beta-barrel protein, partial [Runella sp.]|uniref:outer membrane beta-barrel protein n=1 Tax=Runella sp. TaxID=1960881 RepID=UPI003015D5D3
SATLALPSPTLIKDQDKPKTAKEQSRQTPGSSVLQTNENSPKTSAVSVENLIENKRADTNPKGSLSLLRKAEKAPVGTVLPIPTRNAGVENNSPLAVGAGSKTENIIIAASENPVKGSENQVVAPWNTPSSINEMNGTEQPNINTLILAPLSLPMSPFVYQGEIPMPVVKEAVAPPAPIKVLIDKRLRFGVEAFTSAFIFNQSALGWGGGVGVFAERAFQKHWSATGAVRYRFVPKSKTVQSSDLEDYTSQVRYSFGAQYIEQKKNVSGFHLIEIPLGIQWHTGQFALSAFGAPEIVLGALGKIRKSSTSSLSIDNNYYKAENDLYFASDLYRRFSMSVGTGVEWQAFSSLSLSAQFQYYSSLVKPAVDGARGKGFENINMGLKYRF